MNWTPATLDRMKSLETDITIQSANQERISLISQLLNWQQQISIITTIKNVYVESVNVVGICVSLMSLNQI